MKISCFIFKDILFCFSQKVLRTENNKKKKTKFKSYKKLLQRSGNIYYCAFILPDSTTPREYAGPHDLHLFEHQIFWWQWHQFHQ